MAEITSQEFKVLRENALIFRETRPSALADFVSAGTISCFAKGETITRIGEVHSEVFLVLSGLIRVNACSSLGSQITFLLVKAGEGYNYLGPFMKQSRILEAVAVEETRCLIVGAAKFQNLMTEHPILMSNILGMLGRSLDSANSRLLDFMDKKVENRILRVLNTLYIKFGSPVNFTSREISEIAGTTQASVLRTMGELRRQGVISSGRGRIWIKDEKGLKPCEFGQIII